jgi:hypothetical protein
MIGNVMQLRLLRVHWIGGPDVVPTTCLDWSPSNPPEADSSSHREDNVGTETTC